jgi:uncharacterized protein YkwD
MVFAGCGRIGFDARSDGGGVDAADDATPDAVNPACLIADGVCVFGCARIDDDCSTTCGDGTCIGNAGELCVSCSADCNTTTPVCGNGACDPGEAAAGCHADCGPAPWPWLQEEADLLEQINATRATGYACPAGAVPAAPALTATSFTPGAREWVWELAHQKFFMSGGVVCNGRTFAERATIGGYNAGMNAGGPSTTTVAIALSRWLGDSSQCSALLAATYTQIEVAVAHDADHAFVLLLKQ